MTDIDEGIIEATVFPNEGSGEVEVYYELLTDDNLPLQYKFF